ncbi:MAG: tRNA (guanosine(37)-N1)-methyltransferase TrmD [Clostridia bacterium]
MRIDILTLFPDMCESVLGESIIGRARQNGFVQIECHNIRDYTKNKHKNVDDTPYGGGMGMLMSAQPIYDCYMSLCEKTEEKPHLIFMSPQGKTLNQQRVKELSQMKNVAILCGHYEGVDERVIEEIVDEEISIGDFVLTGGELPALVLADSISRMLDGVLGGDAAFTEESHFNSLLEYPQYTRPAVWQNREVPNILLSGHHANIEKFRREKSLERTYLRRPDMLKNANLGKKDLEFLKNFKQELKQKVKVSEEE